VLNGSGSKIKDQSMILVIVVLNEIGLIQTIHGMRNFNQFCAADCLGVATNKVVAICREHTIVPTKTRNKIQDNRLFEKKNHPFLVRAFQGKISMLMGTQNKCKAMGKCKVQG
jgi:hypothetical protein